MDPQLIDITLHWLNNTLELMQRVCVVMMVAYVAIRIPALRQVLRGVQTRWLYVAFTALFFGVFAILGTHSGLVVDIHQQGRILNWVNKIVSEPLQGSQAIIGFRDLMVLAAGLNGGIRVGLGAGLIAGGERFWLGGFAGPASALATVVQGLLAGLCRRYRPAWTKSLRGTFGVAVLGTVVQKVIILTTVQPFADALALVHETVMPVLIVNGLGCVLFALVLHDLERDRLRDEAQQAQLTALQAQVEPHFLNNTLASIQTLVTLDPEAAGAYLSKLAVFFNETREHAVAHAITLEQELAQVQHYVEFQQLRFREKFIYEAKVPDALRYYQLPPRTLQTLIENALSHALRGLDRQLTITIEAHEQPRHLLLCVRDNGAGIAPERLALLGQREVPTDYSNGTALYQLKQSLDLAFNGHAQLHIASELGAGTTIKLLLPVRAKS